MTSRRVQPENWNDLYSYAEALKRFGETNDPKVFNEFHIPHAAMAECLKAIALGEDAREVFRQTRKGPGRQKMAIFNWPRAYTYWRARAEGKINQEAIELARNYWTIMPAPDDESILRNARKYKKHAFERLRRGGFDIDRLETELARHSHKGKWDDPVGAQLRADAPPHATDLGPGVTEVSPEPIPIVPDDVAPAASIAVGDNRDS